MPATLGMTNTFDLNDVPRVAAFDLQTAVQRVIATGHANLLLGHASACDRASFEEMFWNEFSGETSLGAAILVRLWAMSDVLAARRLQAMLHDRGFVFLRQIAKVAAGQRFSAYRGLNPQHMIWSLKALDQDAPTPSRERLAVPVVPTRPQIFAAAA